MAFTFPVGIPALRMGLALVVAHLPAYAATVEFRRNGTEYQLYKDGQVYQTKGVSGSSYMDKLVAAGGNTIRTYSADKATLDRAQAAGLMVMLGIPGDDLEAARNAVATFKDHPALLMWGLGNEMEMRTADDEGLWRKVEAIAAMVKQVDGRHPTLTCIAEIGGTKLADIARIAPSLDAIGINAYGGAGSLKTRVPAEGWSKPYFVTEFGPLGHWEVPKTPWGMPLEPTSTEKAALYLESYRNLASHTGRCLGTFAFLWGQKQEKTHTWYGMYLPDGTALTTADAMSEAWTGKPPANPGPRIGAAKLSLGFPGAMGDGSQRRFRPGALVECRLDAAMPGGGNLSVTWDLRVDVADNTAEGGAPEPASAPVAGALQRMEGNHAIFRLPDREGIYRIFAYARGATGSTATANAPIQTSATASLADRMGLSLAPYGGEWSMLRNQEGQLTALILDLKIPRTLRLRAYDMRGRSGPLLAEGFYPQGRRIIALPSSKASDAGRWMVREEK